MTKINVLGVGVSAVNIPSAVEIIDSWVKNRLRNYVCVTSVHGIVESQHHDDIKKIHNAAGLVTPDGMPLVWFMKSAGQSQVDRVYGPDLMLAVMKMAAERQYKHFLYGATEDTLERLRTRLETKIAGLRIVGTHAPPFRPLSPAEDAEVIQKINASGADIVWVGLSTPKQERWMASHIEHLLAPVALGVGAAFDFHAGLKSQAPKIVQRSGFEWLFRLATEPRRLWKRYLTIVPYFVVHAICQKVGLKSYLPNR
ncbi:MAG: WecB/TagA/CpsF family glycosyltransferase [Woeseia sp.]|nr:WecB/TagA/CpsF family glycosyltransferase [Woeseia sp.]